jgi:3-methyladenine DNA glycosylase AlkD
MDCRDVLRRLRALSSPEAVAGMARYGINPDNTYGVSIPVLRGLARETGKDHALAGQLWSSGVHEARILAAMIDQPSRVTKAQMESWVRDFDSWDVCDQVCNNLFRKTEWAYLKAAEWTKRREEFVKRAGFVLMAALAVHDKAAGDGLFQSFFLAIAREATDGRTYVRKATNWALRQIGKRSRGLNRKAIATARRMQRLDSRTARWIAADALRELTSSRVQERLQRARPSPRQRGF